MKVNFLKHLSYSNINLFLECPRCWYLKYSHKIELPVPTSWGFGGRVHKAIEEYHLLKKIPPATSDLYAYVGAYSQLYKSKDYDEVEQFWEVPIVNPFDDKEFLPLNLVVKLDRLYKGWIHDVKTSAKPYTFADVDGRIQTALYCYAYRTKYHKIEKGVVYDVLIKRSKPILQPMPTSVGEDDIKNALLYVWNNWRAIVETFKSGEPKYHNPKCKRKEIMP